MEAILLEDLAEMSFRGAFLLIYGELPTIEELKDFQERIVHHILVHEDKIYFRWFFS